MTTSKTSKHNALPNFSMMWQHPAHLFALGFGSGLIQWAPGTFGSLMGILIYWPLSNLAIHLKCLIILTFFLIGISICGKTGKAIGVEDHSSIVWDEIVAIMLVLTFTPNSLFWWAIAFILFRIFDIFKPFPIRQIEQRVGGGLGVMLDDLLAAIYSLLVLSLIQHSSLIHSMA